MYVSFQGQLKVGGHGLQLYNGMVGKDVFFSSVTQNSLDGFPRVSACVLYFRLMAHTDVGRVQNNKYKIWKNEM